MLSRKSHLDTILGTGGTIAGISSFLKEQNKNVKVSLVEPQGSGLVPIKNPEKDVLDWRMKTDEEKKLSSSSILEGIGSSRMYGNFMKAKVDDVVHVNDAVSSR